MLLSEPTLPFHILGIDVLRLDRRLSNHLHPGHLQRLHFLPVALLLFNLSLYQTYYRVQCYRGCDLVLLLLDDESWRGHNTKGLRSLEASGSTDQRHQTFLNLFLK